jgi:iron complex outermembrane receptor protein
MDIIGYILPNWQIYATYGYNDAKIVEDTNPALVGARKQNTPFHSANMAEIQFYQKIMKDFAIGFGIQYSGNKVPMYNRSFLVPDYTLFDAAIYYTPKQGHWKWL